MSENQTEAANVEPKSINANAFIDKVTRGEEVKNSSINGPVIFKKLTLKQSDWSECRFDSSVIIEDCNIFISEPAEKKAINLSNVRIDGGLTISKCSISCKSELKPNRSFGARISGKVETTKILIDNIIIDFELKNITVNTQVQIHSLSIDTTLIDYFKIKTSNVEVSFGVQINLSNAKIAGLSTINLTKYSDASKNCIYQNIIAYNSQISESAYFEGNFNSINFNASNIGENLTIELHDHKQANNIEIIRTRILGDFVCLVKDNWNRADEVKIGKAILNKTKIGRDCYIQGLHLNDNLNIDARPLLKLNSLSIWDCDVSGDIYINDVVIEALDLACINTNERHCVEIGTAINLGKTHAKSAELKNLIIKYKHSNDLISCSFYAAEIRDIELENIKIKFSEGSRNAGNKNRLEAIDASYLDCKSLIIQGVDVERSLGVAFEKPLYNFNSASIGLLNIKSKSCNLIQGASINIWKLDPPNEIAENYIEMLNNSKEYQQLDLNQCIKIEKHLENIGKRSEADKIHIYWRREQQEMFLPNNKFKFIVSLAWDKSIKFGLSPLRPLFVLLPAIIISSILFSYYYGSWVRISSETLSTLNQCGDDCMQYKNEMIADSKAPKNQLISSILLSVSSSTPIIDIGIVKHLEPVPKTPGYWLILLLKILGWVVWPLFLTGLVPLILPKRQ